jgi:apolipoprotein N-acyltransferase
MTGSGPLPEVIEGHSRWVDLSAFIAGALYVLGFAPFNLFPLAILALSYLFLLITHAPIERVFVRGWLFGLGKFGLGVGWVYNSISQFGQTIGPVAGIITLGFVMTLAVYIGLWAKLTRKLFPAQPVRLAMLVLPLSWVLFEWLRGWLFTGFPWLLLGHAQIDNWFAHWAPLAGVYAISLVVALVSGLITQVVMNSEHRIAAVTGVAIIAFMSWGAGQFSWTQPVGEPIRASLVQGNIPQEKKWLLEQRVPTLELYRDLTRQHWDSDLVIWPETALPGYYENFDESFIEPFSREAMLNNTVLLMGVFVKDPIRGSAYNAIVRTGLNPKMYAKRRLVIFGEYMPLRSWLGWLENMLVIPMSDLLTFDGDPVLDVRGVRLGMSICYEDAYGEEVADAIPVGANLLVNVSNDAWFGDSLAPHQHLQIARMRAAELQRTMLRATNTGVSAIVGPRGEIVDRSPQFRTHVLTADVQPLEGITPFAQYRNRPVIILIGLLLTGLWLVGVLRLRKQGHP